MIEKFEQKITVDAFLQISFLRDPNMLNLLWTICDDGVLTFAEHKKESPLRERLFNTLCFLHISNHHLNQYTRFFNIFYECFCFEN